jgi:hypothetical protein
VKSFYNREEEALKIGKKHHGWVYLEEWEPSDESVNTNGDPQQKEKKLFLFKEKDALTSYFAR